MIETNKRTYSSRTSSVISAHAKNLRKRYEEQHGLLTMENYQLPNGFAFDTIVSHYAVVFDKSGNWTKLEAAPLEWADGSVAAGWRNKKSLFIV